MCRVVAPKASSDRVPQHTSTDDETHQAGLPEIPEQRRFDVALRGYERRQVDQHLHQLERQVGSLRAQLTTSERLRNQAQEHANATETEMRALQAQKLYGEDPAPEDSFGYRAEKLLRMAEHEAADVRAKAAKEASTLIEQARAEAERHRHEVEQALISRAALLDQQAGQRTVELQEREQQIAEQLATARAEAEQLQAATIRASDQLREEAEAKAEQIRLRAEQAAQWQRDQATQELQRLSTMHSDVRTELGRLHTILANEIHNTEQPQFGPNDTPAIEASGAPELEAAPPRRPVGKAGAGRSAN